MNLFFRNFGSGKPLIIIHGLFGSSDNWMPFGKKFAENGFEVFAIDLRNHGRSPHSDEFSYSILKDDINNFLIHHNIKKPDIIGHSLGGKLTMDFALSYPDLLNKIIIVDISLRKYFPTSQQSLLVESMKSLHPENFKTLKEIDNKLSEKIPEKSIRNFIIKNLYKNEKQSFSWKINLEVLLKNSGEMLMDFNNKNTFKKPSLFIRGGNSDYISEEDIPKLKYHFPNYRFITIEGATHWVHADKPREFIETVLGFLGSYY